MNEHHTASIPLLQDYDSIMDYIETDVQIFPAFSAPGFPQARTYTGLWDTGSTKSCIKRSIADDLHLIPTGQNIILTANGQLDTDTYCINIMLPNHTVIRNLIVSSANISGNVDILIGMDVINKGSFHIDNHSNRTSFSFQVSNS